VALRSARIKQDNQTETIPNRNAPINPKRPPLLSLSGLYQNENAPRKPLRIDQNRAEEFIDQGRLLCTFLRQELVNVELVKPTMAPRLPFMRTTRRLVSLSKIKLQTSSSFGVGPRALR